MTRDYAILTNLITPQSLPVLRDWLAFMPYPPKRLICYCGYNDGNKALLRELAEETGITLVIAPDTLTEDIRKTDLPVLEWQFAHVEEPYCLKISLDTVPYRKDKTDWLNPMLDIMEREDFVFLTGSTRIFRADTPYRDPDLYRTRRLSLNFAIMRPDVWPELFHAYAGHKETYGRFASEGLIEHHCRETGRYGLRIANTKALRVFHVQVWDDRINDIREAIRSEAKVAPFLTGYEDDQRYAWDMYFMWPRPPIWRRIRIAIGRIRRQVFTR